MTENIHALIQNFLQQKTIVPITGVASHPPDYYTKAGIVPFMRGANGLRFYTLRPKGKMPELGRPQFQFGKGTRMHSMDGTHWQDIKEGKPIGEKEQLVVTGLREGIEELGLRLEAIDRLYDMGAYRFSSATTGKPKDMWLFAALMTSEQFADASQVADTTEERKWLTFAEFEVVGRPDHHYILHDIEARLTAHLE